MMFLSGLLAAALPVGTADEGDGIWHYEGVWTDGDKSSAVHELRTLSSSDGVWRAFRVLLDADGKAFSWQNETRWLDDDGATSRMNQTIVTKEGAAWRRIGIETTFDAPCAGPPMAYRAGERECAGTRTVLGKAMRFSERVTYEVVGTERPGATGVEATRIDATAGSARISYWWSDALCTTLQEEVAAGGTRLVLGLVSGPGCAIVGVPRGPVVDRPDGDPQADPGATAEPDEADSPTAAANDGPAPPDNETDRTLEAPIAPFVAVIFVLVGLLHVARRRQS